MKVLIVEKSETICILKKRKVKFLRNLNSPQYIDEQVFVCPKSILTKNPNKILSLFSTILREYNLLEAENENCFFSSDINEICLDENNNERKRKKEENCCECEDVINNNSSVKNSEQLEMNSSFSKTVDTKEKIKYQVDKNILGECTCICDGRCYYFYRQIDENSVCCCTKYSMDNIKNVKNSNCEPCSKHERPFKNASAEIRDSIIKTCDSKHLLSRKEISSENENQLRLKKKTQNERKQGKWFEENSREKLAVKNVKKSARDYYKSKVRKSSRQNSISKKKHRISSDGVVKESEEKEDCECDENYSSKLQQDSWLITKDQGLMEVHIVYLELSKTATRHLFRDNVFWNASFFISWHIKGQKTSFTPALKYPNLKFESSNIFVTSNLFNFFDYIFKEYITFQVHVLHSNEITNTIAQTKICIKEVLDYPHNKVRYISSVNSILPCSCKSNFGQLSLWTRLSCDLAKIRDFKTQRGIFSEDDLCTLAKRKRQGSKENLSPVVNKEEKFLMKESVDITKITENEPKLTEESYFELPLEKIKKVSSDVTKNELTSEELIDFKLPQDNHDPEIKNKQLKKIFQKDSSVQVEAEDIVEFNKMLSTNCLIQVDSNNTLRDINEVLMDDNWNKYKQKSLKNITEENQQDKAEEDFVDDFYTMTNKEDDKLNYIIIELKSIILFKETYIFLDKNISQLYIEYSFLGYFGEEMETISVLIPESPELQMNYNYRKEFQIDKETHSVQRQILRQMLNEEIDPNIKFIIVSEPLINEPDKECEEIGFALLNLKDCVTGNYTKNMSLQITNTEENKSLGILRITVDGLEGIKSCL